MAKIKRNFLNKFINNYTKKSVYYLGNNVMEHSIYITILFMAFIYIYLAYNYLANLKSCSCAEGEYVEKVKNAEGLLMAILLVWILMCLWLTNNIKKLNKNDIVAFLFLSGGMGVLLFLVYVYFCYNVNKMKKSLTSKCVCAMKWQRWLIYIQYGFFLLEIFLAIVSVIISIIYMLQKR
jgi:hypothetical protein